MKVLLTGANGFLGWHTRLRFHALTDHNVIPVTRSNWAQLPTLLQEADVVIHTAGVNRGIDTEVEHGNIRLAQDLAHALSTSQKPVDVVFANSVHAANGTPYGTGKAAASSLLREVATARGSRFTDVLLPNIFGEHGRPHYNSFVATFISDIIAGNAPAITDNTVPLLHAQDAAGALIKAASDPGSELRPMGDNHGVREIWHTLREFHSNYVPSGQFPDLSSKFRVNLFNAYRAAHFPSSYPIGLTSRQDARGTFVETVRSQGGEGQTSVSSTVPGATRGEHYHLGKVERFAVIAGQARISLRRLFNDRVHNFNVTGDLPVAIDIPTGWAHNITNTGETTLLTQFWTHELFRPDRPDTFPEPVTPPESGGETP